MKKLPDVKLAKLIQELADHTEQAVVLFKDGEGELKIGVLDGVPNDPDWYFAPVSAAEAEQELGKEELGRM